MYQISENTKNVNVRISNDIDVRRMNEFIERNQLETVTSFKDLFWYLLENFENTEHSPSIQAPHILVSDISKEIAAYLQNSENTYANDTEIVKEALTFSPEPIEVIKEVEVIKEIEVAQEIEKDLEENQLLLNLDPDQRALLVRINANRNKALTKRGLPEETLEDTVKISTFLKDRYTHSDEFYTGIE